VLALDGINKNAKPSNANKDLLAVGIGNFLSACIGGLPMISEVVRSKANIEFGAKTEKSNFFHGLFMLIAVLLLSEMLNLIPLASLAALLIFVGIKLASPKEFMHAYKIGLDQFCIFCMTFICTLLSDLLIGVIAGIVLKLFFHMVRNRQIISLFAPKIKANYQNGILCIYISGPLIFIGYAALLSAIEKNISKAKLQGQAIAEIQIILTEVTFLDHTVLQKLQSLPRKYPGIGISIRENKALISSSNHPLSCRLIP
jgi:MFS superfamily sulfate permease-like transporter